ncbi:MAG: D-ribose pyranase [Bacilli bacterium]
MKKTGVLNRDISAVIASMGHYQELVICDAGFPVPDSVRCIDLALEPGLPAFMDVLRVVMKELQVESFVLAKQTMEYSPQRHAEITEFFSDLVPSYVTHTDFKTRSFHAKACIRTGECTPYSNVILVSGVTY